MATHYSIERIKLLNCHVTIRQPKDTEGIDFALTLEVESGSTSDLELDHYFSTGTALPFVHKNESLAITLRSMIDRKPTRVYAENYWVPEPWDRQRG
ncbi:MAG: hypothetical protein C0485_05620 [Pirellula sp.]|nr:hypothetical protein [Pirellula sp.]